MRHAFLLVVLAGLCTAVAGFAFGMAQQIPSGRLLMTDYRPETGVVVVFYLKREPDRSDSVFVRRWDIPPGSRARVAMRDSVPMMVYAPPAERPAADRCRGVATD